MLCLWNSITLRKRLICISFQLDEYMDKAGLCGVVFRGRWIASWSVSFASWMHDAASWTRIYALGGFIGVCLRSLVCFSHVWSYMSASFRYNNVITVCVRDVFFSLFSYSRTTWWRGKLGFKCSKWLRTEPYASSTCGQEWVIDYRWWYPGLTTCFLCTIVQLQWLWNG